MLFVVVAYFFQDRSAHQKTTMATTAETKSNGKSTLKKRKSTLFRRSAAFMRLFNRTSTNLANDASARRNVVLDEEAECDLGGEENQIPTKSNHQLQPNKLKGYVCYNQILAYLK